MLNEKFHLILASQSPRRKELLSHFNVPFQVMVADVNEELNESDPIIYARTIALRKAQHIRDELLVSTNNLIVAADTVVALDQKIYGKPKDQAAAKRMLVDLSGKTHQVCTAVVLMISKQSQWHELVFHELTEVTFAPIDPILLEQYLLTQESLDKAGAYGIQGAALTFISAVKGSYSNVVGFPLSLFQQKMHQDISSIMNWSQAWQRYF